MLVAAVTLVVVGPKEIPRVLRTVRGVISKVRSLSNDFHQTMEEAAREADLHDLKKQLMQEGKQYTASKDELFDSILHDETVGEIRQEVEQLQKNTTPKVDSGRPVPSVETAEQREPTKPQQSVAHE